MKKSVCIILIAITFPVLSVYASVYEFAWLWSDHRSAVDGRKSYRMIADIGLYTGSATAYVDLPDENLTYQLYYWGTNPVYPSVHEYGRAFLDPPPGDWWKTTYQFRTSDGWSSPLFSHANTNFDLFGFVQAKISGFKHPRVTWFPVDDADRYYVRLYKPADDTLLFSQRIDEDGSPSYSYTYRGDLFTQYDHLWVVLEARDYDGDQLLRRTKNYYDHYATPAGEFVITLKLKNVPESLTFYQDHVPDTFLEYSWGVKVDTDANPSTGNHEGYDIEISLANFNSPGSTPVTMSIMDGTQKNTWVLHGGGASIANPIKAEIDYGNHAIVMVVRETFAELSGFDITDRFQFKTLYYSPAGPVGDETSENSAGSNNVSDPEDDVGYDFIDILEGKIEYRPYRFTGANSCLPILLLGDGP